MRVCRKCGLIACSDCFKKCTHALARAGAANTKISPRPLFIQRASAAILVQLPIIIITVAAEAAAVVE